MRKNIKRCAGILRDIVISIFVYLPFVPLILLGLCWFLYDKLRWRADEDL